MERDEKILAFLEKGLLLSPELAEELDTLEAPLSRDDLLLLDARNKGFADEPLDWQAFDDAKVAAEKRNEPRPYEGFAGMAERGELARNGIRIISNYVKRSRKYAYEDFVAHFNQRFKALAAILRQRSELQGAMSITRLARRGANERVALIAMVDEKSVTKNGNVMLTLEDQTGRTKALVTAKNAELHAAARDLVPDEVVGLTGSLGDGIIFINGLFFPDVPVTHELKKTPNEEWLAVIGDPQVGGKQFLAKDFAKLLAWFNGRLGNEEQRAIAAKVRYAVVVGDLVEGVGVYPGQEEGLTLKDIKEQYQAFADLLRQIPSTIRIFCIPGNHDAGRISEPQPPIYKDFAPALYAMENVTMLSSPSLVTIAEDPEKGFSGLDLLLYHGYSLTYYADNVPSIRERGGQKRAELIMKFLLQRRHLAPTHGSNLYIPDPEQDSLVIAKVPDLFLTGHIHRVASAVYRGVTLINGSAWCDIDEYQEKRGLEPQPARLVLVNLQTRDVKVINFFSGKGKGVAVAAPTEQEATP